VSNTEFEGGGDGHGHGEGNFWSNKLNPAIARYCFAATKKLPSIAPGVECPAVLLVSVPSQNPPRLLVGIYSEYLIGYK
jgi:hypothetical protein